MPDSKQCFILNIEETAKVLRESFRVEDSENQRALISLIISSQVIAINFLDWLNVALVNHLERIFDGEVVGLHEILNQLKVALLSAKVDELDQTFK